MPSHSNNKKGKNLEKSFQNLPKLGGFIVTHPSGFLPPAENLHFGDGLSKADRSAFAFFSSLGPGKIGILGFPPMKGTT